MTTIFILVNSLMLPEMMSKSYHSFPGVPNLGYICCTVATN